jgi:DUF2945 family protein
MAPELKKGDRVEWNFRGTKVTGTVERKLTSRTKIDGRVAAATPDDPRYLLRTEKSGKEVAHKPSALKKIR